MALCRRGLFPSIFPHALEFSGGNPGGGTTVQTECLAADSRSNHQSRGHGPDGNCSHQRMWKGRSLEEKASQANSDTELVYTLIFPGLYQEQKCHKSKPAYVCHIFQAQWSFSPSRAQKKRATFPSLSILCSFCPTVASTGGSELLQLV